MPKRLRDPEKVRQYRKTFYGKNRLKVRAEIEARKQEIRDWFSAYKATLWCAKCRESDPACLDFHHDDPNEKDLAIARAVNDGWSRERILAEVQKCTVLCANCHRKQHYYAGLV